MALSQRWNGSKQHKDELIHQRVTSYSSKYETATSEIQNRDLRTCECVFSEFFSLMVCSVYTNSMRIDHL